MNYKRDIIHPVIHEALVFLIRKIDKRQTRDQLENIAQTLRSQVKPDTGNEKWPFSADQLEWGAVVHEFAAQARFPEPGDQLPLQMIHRMKEEALRMVQGGDDRELDTRAAALREAMTAGMEAKGIDPQKFAHAVANEAQIVLMEAEENADQKVVQFPVPEQPIRRKPRMRVSKTDDTQQIEPPDFPEQPGETDIEGPSPSKEEWIADNVDNDNEPGGPSPFRR